MNDLEMDNIDAILKDGFNVLIEHLKQRFDYLRNFTIKNHIGDADSKDSPLYKRGMDMADGLPKLIMEINKLRGVDSEKKKEEPETPRMIPVSPQSIAKSKVG